MSQKVRQHAVSIDLQQRPDKIGADIICNAIIPMIPTITQDMDQGQIALLYAGILSAIHGSMAADLGRDIALDLLRMGLMSLEKVELEEAQVKH